MMVHHREKILLFSLLLVAGFALLGTPVLAFSPQLSLHELAQRADLVLSGRVEHIVSSYADDGLIYTEATILVDRMIAGTLSGDRVRVSVPGGAVGDVGLWVSDAPRFAAGDEVLLFLQGGEDARLLGGHQGAFAVEDGELVGSGFELDQVEHAVKSVLTNNAVNPASSASALADATLDAGLSFIWGGVKWGSPGATGEPFYVNENGAGCAGAIAAIRAAAMTWSTVPGADFTLGYGGTTAMPAPAKDGWNTVAWKNMGSYPSALAAAYTWYSVPDMIIFEADMVINRDYGWSASETCPVGLSDVQNVTTHELGHWAGLKDLVSPADTEKTMYAGSWLGETKKRSLEPDDEDGLRAIYPANTRTVSPSVVSPGEWGTPGSWQVFTATYTCDGGCGSIRYADFLVAAATDAPQAVYARYDVQADKLFLRSPTGGTWLPFGGKAPGEGGLIRHIYGCLDAQHTTVELRGDVLVVKWSLLFTSRMSGTPHLMHLATEEASGVRTAWRSYGSWTVNRSPILAPPELNKVAVPAGEKLMFTPRYRDLDGRETLAELYYVIADVKPTAGVPVRDAVYLKFDNATGRMYLRNRADTAWIPANGVAPRTAFLIGNGLVKVYGPGSRIINADSKTFKPMWILEFEGAFRGRHVVYMRAVDELGGDLGGDTDWKWKGWLEVQ